MMIEPQALEYAEAPESPGPSLTIHFPEHKQVMLSLGGSSCITLT